MSLEVVKTTFFPAVLLCFCFLCECREKKQFQQYMQFDGNQTLMAYNDEGGGSSCKVCTC